MTSRKSRMLRGTTLLALTEVISRFFPLIVIRQTKQTLGIDQFGESQALITSVDILMQLIGPAYATLAALDIAKNPSNRQHIGSVVSSTIAIRLLHAIVVLIFVFLSYFAQDWSQHSPFEVALYLLAAAAVFDLDFLHTSLQKMEALSLIAMATKTIGFLSIIFLVNDPTDKLLYCALYIGANSLFSLGTFLYHKHSFQLYWPKKTELAQLAMRALPLNFGFMLFVVLDRFDLLLVNQFYGGTETGIYAIPLKLVQSIAPLLLSVSRVFFSEMLTQHADRGFVSRLVRMECLLCGGVLIPLAVASYWTSPFVLNLLFASSESVYSTLMPAITLSSTAATAIYIFGYQILWRHEDYRKVIAGVGATLLISLLMVALGTQSLGLVGIPVGLIVGKSLGVVYLAYSANKYLDRLPVREVLMVTLSTLPMALVVSAFASQPLLAIALGILIYGFCQMVYYTADPQHPLKS